jgi:hypothetical protein
MNTTKLAVTALLSASFGVVLTLSLVSPLARAQAPAPEPRSRGTYRVASAASAGAAEQVLNRMETNGYVFVGSATHASSPEAFLIFKGK